MQKLVPPIGKKFGRLTVVGSAPQIDHNTRWACLCDCGNTKDCRPSHLKTGNIQSCGCLASERRRERLTTHGRSYSRLYVRWTSMLARCYYPVTRGWQHYGGRGIKVCDRWRFGENGASGFACFLADMGEPPGPGYSLDRIDVNGNYEPNNVRWATAQEQAANSRRSIAMREREAAQHDAR